MKNIPLRRQKVKPNRVSKWNIYYFACLKPIIMTELTAKYDDRKFIIYNSDTVYGSIAFESDNLSARINYGNNELLASQDPSDKNIVITREGTTLFKFKFDYLWGGAEIMQDGADSGFDIKGRWFKPGTRLTDEHDTDLAVIVTEESIVPQLRINVIDEDLSPVMVLASIYYHIYLSGGKLRSLLMAVSR
jgi:hypothetical protein